MLGGGCGPDYEATEEVACYFLLNYACQDHQDKGPSRPA